jgi:hypothetical protein
MLLMPLLLRHLNRNDTVRHSPATCAQRPDDSLFREWLNAPKTTPTWPAFIGIVLGIAGAFAKSHTLEAVGVVVCVIGIVCVLAFVALALALPLKESADAPTH